MSRRRSIALVVLLVLAGYDFSFQPQRLVASFKAMRCCQENCHKSRPLSAAERCCGVAQDQAGLRAVHANAPDLRAAAAVIAVGEVALVPLIATQEIVARTSEPSRSPPIFLSNRSLLL